MKTEEIPICEICEQPMTPLPKHTLRQDKTVFVCSKPQGKSKVSCDGAAYYNATKNA